MKTMKAEELGIEFTLKQEQNNKKFSELEIPEGWKVFTIPLFMQLWNLDKYRKAILKTNDNEFWTYLENFDYLKDKYVAGFDADSDGVGLSCDGDPGDSGASLGVIFYRELK